MYTAEVDVDKPDPVLSRGSEFPGSGAAVSATGSGGLGPPRAVSCRGTLGGFCCGCLPTAQPLDDLVFLMPISSWIKRLVPHRTASLLAPALLASDSGLALFCSGSLTTAAGLLMAFSLLDGAADPEGCPGLLPLSRFA